MTDLSLITFMSGALPGGLTLGEIEEYLVENDPTLAQVREHSTRPNAQMRIRVVRIADETALSSSTTLEVARGLVNAGLARVVVDDEGGGLPVGELQPA